MLLKKLKLKKIICSFLLIIIVKGTIGIHMKYFDNKKSKLSKVIFTGIDIAFVCMLFGIFIGTLLMDKNINNAFPNTVKWSNGGYYFIAMFVLIFLCLFYRLKSSINNKVYNIILLSIFGIMVVIQIIITLWMPVDVGADFQVVKEMAIKLAQGGGFQGDSYFKAQANNVPITILFKTIYQLFGSWKVVIYIGALLVNISMVLLALSIKNITNNKYVSLCICLIGEVLVTLSWRTYIPYTDNFGMIFIAFIVFLYTTNIRKGYKMFIIFVVSIIGTFIKPTILIPLLAIIIYEILKIIEYNRKISSKKIVAIVVGGVIILSSRNITKDIMYTVHNYETGVETKGWQFFLLAGQDTEGLGTVGQGIYSEVYKKICKQYKSSEERKQACFDVATEWIKERGVWGNLDFYIKKLDVAYNDGYFNNVQFFNKDKVEKNMLYEIYCKKGKYYSIGANIFQVLWDLILVIIGMSVLVRKDIRIINKYEVFEIMILGITAYLMLFEGRSKYLFMFLPIYIAFSGIILDEIGAMINKWILAKVKN